MYKFHNLTPFIIFSIWRYENDNLSEAHHLISLPTPESILTLVSFLFTNCKHLMIRFVLILNQNNAGIKYVLDYLAIIKS